MPEEFKDSELDKQLRQAEAAAEKVREEARLKQAGDQLAKEVAQEAGLAIAERKFKRATDSLRAAVAPDTAGEKSADALTGDVDRVVKELKRERNNPPEPQAKKE